jgi:hypothetical protein
MIYALSSIRRLHAQTLMVTGITSPLWSLIMMAIVFGPILCLVNGLRNRQCIFHSFLFFFELMLQDCRTRFLRIHQHMVLCLLPSLRGVIKLLHLLQQVIKSSTYCMLAWVMSITPHVEHMVMDSCRVPFFPFQKVLYLTWVSSISC